MEQTDDLHTDIVIIGAGPIGIEMAAVLKRMDTDYVHFEAGQIGQTLTWWPRNTTFFSTTERIELAGIPAASTSQERMTGEEYLAYLRAITEQLDLQVRTYEPVTGIARVTEGFTVTSEQKGIQRRTSCRKIILANGDMDFPNLLRISGEDLPHVSHYFVDPHMYFRKDLLIVGGRNSAVESALRCWRAGARVTLSYRRAEFDERAVKHWLLPDLITQIELGTIRFLPETTPVEITPTHVRLRSLRDVSQIEEPADFVLLATGFAANTRLFEMAGIHLTGPERAPEVDPHTMESSIPGIYVAGTAAAGTQTKYRLFIENCHEHVGKIALALTGKWPDQLGTIPARQYEAPYEDFEAN